MIELKSFDLEVLGSREGGYTIRAVGPDDERDSAPFEAGVLNDLAADLEAITGGAANRATLERIGGILFQALFPMPILVLYLTAKARLAQGEGLRLRLHLPPELARLPWELLYYPPNFFCLDPASPVVRFLDLPEPPRPLAVASPLRLLHLVAGPDDAPRLDAEGEARQVREALTELLAADRVALLPGRPGTLATLQDQMRQGCHVVHFTGHGGLSGDEGYLLFEDEDGYGQPVTSDTLAQYLRGPGLRLAFLNACQSAQAGTGDAFGSVAAALVRAGLPAVVAHQQALPDRSAQAFAAEFYDALADGYPVDAAVTEGRKAILTELGGAWRERVDWATPVLFMQAPDGHVFAVGNQTGEAKDPLVKQRISTGDVGRDVITMGDVSGQVTIGGAGPPPPQQPARLTASERLLNLLGEFRQRVREEVSEAGQDEAVEKLADLKSASMQDHPDLETIASTAAWFEAEWPRLSGALFGILAGVEQKVKASADDLLPEFRRRFGEFS